MRKNEFRFKSCDGITKIHGTEWVPEGNPKAVLQICHGMMEYIGRYEEMARYLAEKGYVVLGHDHLGHGESVTSEENLGYFAEKRGNQCVLGDIHKLHNWASKRYPGKPYFLLGHSMGSFLVRQYITTYDDDLAGVMILGTGNPPKLALEFGKGLCSLMAAVKGWRYRSKLITAIAIGGYNRTFEPAETNVEWLTTDENKKMQYAEDEKCGFTFTLNAYYSMFEGMLKLQGKKPLVDVDKDLPILFASGNDDPVGDFGKGVKKVYQKYQKAGFTNVELSLYPDKRHELFNEVGRDRIFEDFYFWLENQL